MRIFYALKSDDFNGTQNSNYDALIRKVLLIY